MINRNEKFSKRLNQAMQNCNIRPVDLANKLGISEGTISRYRNGDGTPRNDRLQKISNILKVNPMWLLGFEDNPDVIEITENKKIELTPEQEKVLNLLDYLNDLGVRKVIEILNDMKYIPRFQKQVQRLGLSANNGEDVTMPKFLQDHINELIKEAEKKEKK